MLVTDEAYQQIASAFPGAPQRILELKGVRKPVTAYSLRH
jgi:class 3 adenylate cyclase